MEEGGPLSVDDVLAKRPSKRVDWIVKHLHRAVAPEVRDQLYTILTRENGKRVGKDLHKPDLAKLQEAVDRFVDLFSTRQRRQLQSQDLVWRKAHEEAKGADEPKKGSSRHLDDRSRHAGTSSEAAAWTSRPFMQVRFQMNSAIASKPVAFQAMVKQAATREKDQKVISSTESKEAADVGPAENEADKDASDRHVSTTDTASPPAAEGSKASEERREEDSAKEVPAASSTEAAATGSADGGQEQAASKQQQKEEEAEAKPGADGQESSQAKGAEEAEAPSKDASKKEEVPAEGHRSPSRSPSTRRSLGDEHWQQEEDLWKLEAGLLTSDAKPPQDADAARPTDAAAATQQADGAAASRPKSAEAGDAAAAGGTANPASRIGA
eukprot:TRINITY_DN40165_c0_g1_i1.p1 TRINITY_DN40165_c0_g1~~TRINITY_DN40165_c0_g1_i1.p1  ORF type:complete len:382 (-),score=126.68 TRINITY_DN40165_c0_g1_i1:36-1181(-)